MVQPTCATALGLGVGVSDLGFKTLVFWRRYFTTIECDKNCD